MVRAAFLIVRDDECRGALWHLSMRSLVAMGVEDEMEEIETWAGSLTQVDDLMLASLGYVHDWSKKGNSEKTWFLNVN